MTLPTTKELQEQLTADSIARSAKLTHTLDRVIKPLLLFFGLFYAVVLTTHFYHPSILGAVIATIFCTFSIVTLVWHTKVSLEISKEASFRENISSGKTIVMVDIQYDFIIPDGIDPNSQDAVSAVCAFLYRNRKNITPIRPTKLG